jgi:hypothetical protein
MTMSDYHSGYSRGRSDGQSESGASGAAGAALLILLVIVGIGVALFTILYPLAAALTLVAVALMAWAFSAFIGVVWHDPSPNYIFGNHLLYENHVGVGLAVLCGIAVAYYLLRHVEFPLARNRAYLIARHVWRVLFPVVAGAVALAATQDQTGISKAGLWLIPLAVAVPWHFFLWYKGPVIEGDIASEIS